jgi:CRP-like cAMP-binding protein
MRGLQNRLLNRLSDDSFGRLAPHLEPVDLPLNTVLVRPGMPIQRVVFMESGLSSDIAMVSDDRGVECGLAGKDGLVGIPVLLGLDRGIHTTVIQVAGTGVAVEARRLPAMMAEDAELRRVLLAYVHVFLAQASQSAACNVRHPVEERLARWILMAHDRLSSDEIPLTHAYLSLMLGIRRAGVTVAIHVLEGEGLIRGERGRLTVRDRAGLEQRSCPCYGLVRTETDRVFAAVPAEAVP